MESTSVYWIPVYEVLERAGFEVLLVSPRMTKQISGRKSDVLDCQWIWQLQSYGLLRGSFRPRDAVCPLRAYVRQARRLIADRSRSVQHMQKALTEMNVRLDSVIADLAGVTGLRIVRAIVAGERDPHRLASLRHRAIRASADTIAASLEGTWRAEHLFSLEQALARHDFLEQQIEACETRIAAMIDDLTPPAPAADGGGASDAPAPAARRLTDPRSDKARRAALHRMMGVDLTAIPTIGTGTALTVAAEIGPDFSAFPSVQHFCSWLGVAPGTRISGGKALPGRAPKVVNPVGQALRMAAVGARRSQSFVGARHRARLARKDAAVAVNATARELACLIYLMVTRGQEYIEKGVEAWEKQRAERTHASLLRKARALGYVLSKPADGDTSSDALTAA